MPTMKEIIDFFEGMDENNGRIVIKSEIEEEPIFGDKALEVLSKDIGDLEYCVDAIVESVSSVIEGLETLAEVVSKQQNKIESLEKEIGRLKVAPQNPSTPEYTFTGYRDHFAKQPQEQSTHTTNTTSEEQLRKDLRKLFGLE